MGKKEKAEKGSGFRGDAAKPRHAEKRQRGRGLGGRKREDTPKMFEAFRGKDTGVL